MQISVITWKNVFGKTSWKKEKNNKVANIIITKPKKIREKHGERK